MRESLNEGNILKTPRQEEESCRGVGQRVMGGLEEEIRGGCRRCSSRVLGCWRGVGSLRRRNGGSREPWWSVSANG